MDYTDFSFKQAGGLITFEIVEPGLFKRNYHFVFTVHELADLHQKAHQALYEFVENNETD